MSDPRAQDQGRHDPGPEPQIDPELARALAAHDPPPARPAFRAALRATFLAGVGDDEATDPRPATDLERALRQAEPAPPSEPFRASLRARFLGAKVEDAETEDVAPHPPGATPSAAPTRRPRPSAARPAGEAAPRPARAARRRFQLLAGGLLAAAAAVLLLVGPFEDPDAAPSGSGPVADGGAFVDHWFVDPETYVRGEVLVDGERLAADLSVEELTARIANAETVATGDSRLYLQYGPWMVVSMDHDSELDLTGMPDDPGGGVYQLATSRGGFQVRTAPRFRDDARELHFQTPAGQVQVLGTVFGVNCLDEGTCVCCTEGQVKVCPTCPLQGEHHVDAGKMSLVFAEQGKAPMGGDVHEAHAPALEALKAYAFKTHP